MLVRSISKMRRRERKKKSRSGKRDSGGSSSSGSHRRHKSRRKDTLDFASSESMSDIPAEFGETLETAKSSMSASVKESATALSLEPTCSLRLGYSPETGCIRDSPKTKTATTTDDSLIADASAKTSGETPEKPQLDAFGWTVSSDDSNSPLLEGIVGRLPGQRTMFAPVTATEHMPKMSTPNPSGADLFSTSEETDELAPAKKVPTETPERSRDEVEDNSDSMIEGSWHFDSDLDTEQTEDRGHHSKTASAKMAERSTVLPRHKPEMGSRSIEAVGGGRKGKRSQSMTGGHRESAIEWERDRKRRKEGARSRRQVDIEEEEDECEEGDGDDDIRLLHSESKSDVSYALSSSEEELAARRRRERERHRDYDRERRRGRQRGADCECDKRYRQLSLDSSMSASPPPRERPRDRDREHVREKDLRRRQRSERERGGGHRHVKRKRDSESRSSSRRHRDRHRRERHRERKRTREREVEREGERDHKSSSRRERSGGGAAREPRVRYGRRRGRSDGTLMMSPKKGLGFDTAVRSERRSGGRSNKWDLVYLTSSPLVRKGLDGYQPLPQLDVSTERSKLWAILKEACDKKPVAAGSDSLKFRVRHFNCTSSNLIHCVTIGCRILHYSGHGIPDSLVFEDPRELGLSHNVHASLLAKILFDCDAECKPELVFASACHSESVAKTFLRSGVAHVIAVKSEFELKDDAAVEFTKHFYRALLNGLSILSSFNQATNAVSGLSKSSRMDAAKIVLLPEDGSHDVVLFPNESSTKSKREEETGSGSLAAATAEDQSSAGLTLMDDTPPESVMTLDNPFTVPPAIDRFTGRAIEMRELISHIMDDGVNIVSIYGNAGVGKSALSLMAARYLYHRRVFTGGVFWIDCAKWLPLEDEGKSGESSASAGRVERTLQQVFELTTGSTTATMSSSQSSALRSPPLLSEALSLSLQSPSASVGATDSPRLRMDLLMSSPASISNSVMYVFDNIDHCRVSEEQIKQTFAGILYYYRRHSMFKILVTSRVQKRELSSVEMLSMSSSSYSSMMTRYYHLKRLKSAEDSASLFSRLCDYRFPPHEITAHPLLMRRLDGIPSNIVEYARIYHFYQCSTLKELVSCVDGAKKVKHFTSVMKKKKSRKAPTTTSSLAVLKPVAALPSAAQISDSSTISLSKVSAVPSFSDKLIVAKAKFVAATVIPESEMSPPSVGDLVPAPKKAKSVGASLSRVETKKKKQMLPSSISGTPTALDGTVMVSAFESSSSGSRSMSVSFEQSLSGDYRRSGRRRKKKSSPPAMADTRARQAYIDQSEARKLAKRKKFIVSKLSNLIARKLWLKSGAEEVVSCRRLFGLMNKEFANRTNSIRGLLYSQFCNACKQYGARLSEDGGYLIEIEKFDGLCDWFAGLCTVVSALSNVWSIGIGEKSLNVFGDAFCFESSKKVEELLSATFDGRSLPNGTFLLRFSLTTLKCITVSYKNGRRVEHLRGQLIEDPTIGSSRFFFKGLDKALSLDRFVRAFKKLTYLYCETSAAHSDRKPKPHCVLKSKVTFE